MILVSVGTQLPFDRLIKALDQWAAAHPEVEVIAQIGPSHYVPKAMTASAFFTPLQFRELQERCSLMVSHAGIGSIVNALELGKPIIILGRDDLRHEHRNGHQISTVKRFGNLPGIYAARDEQHLIELQGSCGCRDDTLHGGSDRLYRSHNRICHQCPPPAPMAAVMACDKRALIGYFRAIVMFHSTAAP